MFKKFKDKLAEEMKQSPARLQASMQQLAQAVSPALSNSSIQDISASNDNFSLSEEVDETPKNSPARHGFQTVDLTSPSGNSMGVSRRSSISSVASDASSLFPVYESPGNMYHLQSDMDQSASELDDMIGPQLDRVTKDQLYSTYRKVQTKYHKYRSRYTDLAAHYREMERVKNKLEALLVETQDKALRRISDLKEQCQLEQQAKAHLEDALRNDIEEKDHVINTLNTKIALLQSNGQQYSKSNQPEDKTGDKTENHNAEMLIDFHSDSQAKSSADALKSNEDSMLLTENVLLKDKLQNLEKLIEKYKDMLKRGKDKITQLNKEKSTIQSDFDSLKANSNDRFTTLEGDLNAAREQILNLQGEIQSLKKREEESMISLAENKLTIHRELEDKEEQIKRLTLDVKQITEERENLQESLEKYKSELEKKSQMEKKLETENKEQENSKKRAEVLKQIQKEMHQKYQEEVDRNKELLSRLEEIERKSTEKNEAELSASRNKISVLENDLESERKLNLDLNEKYQEFKIAEDGNRKALGKLVEELQTSKKSLESEIEDLNKLLREKEECADHLSLKIQELGSSLEKAKQNLAKQNEEIKVFREKEISEKGESQMMRLQEELENKNEVVLNLRDQVESCKKEIESLNREKNSLFGQIGICRDSICKMKEESVDLKKKVSLDIEEGKIVVSHFLKEISATFPAILEENAGGKKNIEDLNSKLEDLMMKYKNIESELRASRKREIKLEKEAKERDDEFEEMKLKVEKFDELNFRNEKLIAEIDGLNFRFDDIESLKHEKKNLETSIEVLSSRNEELDRDWEREAMRVLALSVEFQIVRSELSNSKNQNSELRNSIEELQETLNGKLELIKKLKAIKENQGKTIKDLSFEIDESKTKISEMGKEIEDLREKEKNFEILREEHLAILAELGKIQNIKNEVDSENKNLKDKKNELLKLNKDLKISEGTLKSRILSLEAKVEKLSTENQNLESEFQKQKAVSEDFREDLKELEYLREENSEKKNEVLHLRKTLMDFGSIQNKSEALFREREDLGRKVENLEGEKEVLNKKIEDLSREVSELKIVEDKKKELEAEIEVLKKEILKMDEVKNKNIELENRVSDLNLEIVKLNELSSKVESLESKLGIKDSEIEEKELELKNLNSQNKNLHSENKNLDSENKNLKEEIKKQIEEKEILKMDEVKNKNIELENRVSDLNLEIVKLNELSSKVESLESELGIKDSEIEEKELELKNLHSENKNLDSENKNLKEEIKKQIEEKEIEFEECRSRIADYERRIQEKEEEISFLKKEKLEKSERIKDIEGDSKLKEERRLEEEKRKLEAQLDEALITFQAKESQMEILNNDLKNQIEKLKEELKVGEAEQGLRLKQLVKEFQAQLHDKDEELQAALDKRFDQQQNYETDLIQQFKEQLKDFQIELTLKSEQIENLILEGKESSKQKQGEIDKLLETIVQIRQEHVNELQDVEKKWKQAIKEKSEIIEAKHEEEVSELTKEWQNERRTDSNSEGPIEELESTSRLAMAAVQSNTGSFHTLQQTLASQKRELAELRKLVKLRHDALEDSTEIEYLRNILFEYMMGRETLVLARVISAVVKFDSEQTTKVLKKEEDKMTLLGSLGLS